MHLLEGAAAVGFGFDGDDGFVRIVGDDEEDLAGDLVDVELLDERSTARAAGERLGRRAGGLLQAGPGEAHDRPRSTSGRR
jgi:hypothetical protein